jgi:hypothetical protein
MELSPEKPIAGVLVRFCALREVIDLTAGTRDCHCPENRR